VEVKLKKLLSSSVAKATIRAVEKELKERRVKATASKGGSYIKVTD